MSDDHSGLPSGIKTSITLLAVIMALPFLLYVIGPEKAKVTIDGKTHTVVVANSAARQYRGLSGKTPQTIGAEGMLFPFPNDQERVFIMRDMKFALDVLWVRDGKIVKIETNVPYPVGGTEPVKMYSAPEKADGVLEFPAGFVQRNGIAVGDIVTVK